MKKSILQTIICLSICILCSCVWEQNETSPSEIKLWQGITQGNMAMVKDAIDEGHDINAFESYYEKYSTGGKINSTVVIALYHGEVNIAGYLLDNGADVNLTVDRNERSLLQYCVERSSEICKKAIEKGADINYTDKKGNNALDYAYNGLDDQHHGDNFDLLIESGAVVTEQNIKNALEKVEYKKFGALRKLLEVTEYDKIDITLKNAFIGNSEYVKTNAKAIEDFKLLTQVVAAFCDVDSLKAVENEETDYQKILNIAVRYNNIPVVEYALQKCEKTEELFNKELAYNVITSGSVDILNMLYENGASFSMQDFALGSIQYNRPQILEYMFNHGLDVNFETGRGNMLVVAVSQNNLDLVKMLVEHGVNINGDDSYNPLVEACEYGYYDIAKYLIESGADVNSACRNTRFDMDATPLLASVRYGSEECTELLMQNGADKGYVNFEGVSVDSILKEFPSPKMNSVLQPPIHTTYLVTPHQLQHRGMNTGGRF